MSRGYRYSLIAIVGWLTLTGWAEGHGGGRGNYYKQHSSTNQSANQSVQLAPLKNLSNTVAVKTPCDTPLPNNERDLCEQWRMAEAADQMVKVSWGQLVLTGLSLLGLAITIGYTRHQAKIAGEANDVAREVGRDQTRAYVYAETVEYTAKPAGAFIASIKNGGQTPAKDVEVLIFMGTTNKNKRSMSKPDDVKSLCWGLIGPGDSIPVPVFQKDIAEVLKEFVSVEEDRSLTIIGTIIYDTIYDEKRQTEFIFTTYDLFDPTKPFKFGISVQEGTIAFAPRRKLET